MVKMDTFQDGIWRVSLDSEALFWISTFSHNDMRLSLKQYKSRQRWKLVYTYQEKSLFQLFKDLLKEWIFPICSWQVSLLWSCLVIQMSFVIKNLYFLKSIKHLQLFSVLRFPGILPISTCKFVLLLPLLCRMLCSSQRNPYFSSHKLLYLFSHPLNYFFW